jgi:hypothetical protein
MASLSLSLSLSLSPVESTSPAAFRAPMFEGGAHAIDCPPALITFKEVLDYMHCCVQTGESLSEQDHYATAEGALRRQKAFVLSDLTSLMKLLSRSHFNQEERRKLTAVARSLCEMRPHSKEMVVFNLRRLRRGTASSPCCKRLIHPL